jgi:hypothetical protein
VIWKLMAAIALGAAIIVSLRARPPRQSIPAVDLRRMVFGALVLYGVGSAAWITHHHALATGVYAAGILTASLAAWLSRGRDSDELRRGLEDIDGGPPFGPDEFDWPSFERDFLAYAEGRREPAGLD